MKNYLQPGCTLTVTAPVGGCVSGELYKVGSIIGVATRDAAAGNDVELQVDGVFNVAKVSAQAWAVGDPLYYVTANRNLTNVSAAGVILVGVATAVAANPSATGNARFNGTLGVAAQAA